MKICRENTILVQIGKKYWALYMKNHTGSFFLFPITLDCHKGALFE